jgi:tRNA pseudouridine38-40 synthase
MEAMRQIKLIVEYDGTNYVGWQLQPNGISIQQVLEEALTKLLGEHVRVHSSGRTDAGVHALGMVAAFKTDRGLPLKAFVDGMNCLIPPDIAVQSAEEVALEFNPRADAKGKHYRYTIHNAKQRSPSNRIYAWHLREKLDLAAMQGATEHFIGEHDFAAFRTSGCAAKTTIRRINRLNISRDGELVIIDVYGTGFLRNMVRIMVGTLVEIGLGKRPPLDVAILLANPSKMSAGATAPPHGLSLVEVFY